METATTTGAEQHDTGDAHLQRQELLPVPVALHAPADGEHQVEQRHQPEEGKKVVELAGQIAVWVEPHRLPGEEDIARVELAAREHHVVHSASPDRHARRKLAAALVGREHHVAHPHVAVAPHLVRQDDDAAQPLAALDALRLECRRAAEGPAAGALCRARAHRRRAHRAEVVRVEDERLDDASA
eukprot:5283939-Prymnesium_polylepis.2